MVYNLIDLIPNAFKKSTLSNHVFSISYPWWSCFDTVELNNGNTKRIESCAYCKYFHKDIYVSVLIPLQKSPKLAHAIMKVGQLPQFGRRESKYLDLYNIYEGMQKANLPYHSALRNSFSHSKYVLTRPATLVAMKELFGTVEVNLNK